MNKHSNSTKRVPPDLQVCRAADLTEMFAECLVEKPDACPYAMPFGYSHLCGSPDRDAIIANTKRLQTKKHRSENVTSDRGET